MKSWISILLLFLITNNSIVAHWPPDEVKEIKKKIVTKNRKVSEEIFEKKTREQRTLKTIDKKFLDVPNNAKAFSFTKVNVSAEMANEYDERPSRFMPPKYVKQNVLTLNRNFTMHDEVVKFMNEQIYQNKTITFSWEGWFKGFQFDLDVWIREASAIHWWKETTFTFLKSAFLDKITIDMQYHYLI